MNGITLTAMENLTNAVTSLTTMATNMLDVALEHPVLALCFAGGFVSVIVGVIHKVKNV